MAPDLLTWPLQTAIGTHEKRAEHRAARARARREMPAILLEHDQSPPPPAQLSMGGASASQGDADPGMSPVTIQLMATGSVCLFLGIAFLAIRWYLHRLLHPTPILPASDFSSVLVAFDWCVAAVHTRSPHTRCSAGSAYAECATRFSAVPGAPTRRNRSRCPWTA